MTGRRPSGCFPLPAHCLAHGLAHRLGRRGEVPLRRRDAGVAHQFLDLQDIHAFLRESAAAFTAQVVPVEVAVNALGPVSDSRQLQHGVPLRSEVLDAPALRIAVGCPSLPRSWGEAALVETVYSRD